MRGRNRSLAILAAAVAVTGVSPGAPVEDPGAGFRTDISCVITDVYAPSCGAWWGVSPGAIGLAELEKRVGRRFGIVHRWHGVDQNGIPTTEERRLARHGRYLHLNVEARKFTESGHPVVQWSEIAGGTFDAALRAQAERVAELGLPVFVTFDHEADQDSKLGVRGSAEEFVAAWRHIREIYRSAGASNAIWVWVVTGYEGNFHKVADLYPGDAYVDWVAWEAYNASGCRTGQPDPERYRSFEETLRPFYEWLQTEGVRAGIDPDKPYMITEMGSVVYPDAPERTAEWYAGVVPTLQKYSQIRAVQLWNEQGQGSCDYRVTRDQAVLDSYTETGRHRYVNPP